MSNAERVAMLLRAADELEGLENGWEMLPPVDLPSLVDALRNLASELEGTHTPPARDAVIQTIADAVGAPGGFVCSYCGYDAEEIASAVLAARVAVVRPTREQIARCISRSFLGSDPYNAAADAVLALFGVAVSDSQETPTEGREK